MNYQNMKTNYIIFFSLICIFIISIFIWNIPVLDTKDLFLWNILSNLKIQLLLLGISMFIVWKNIIDSIWE